MKKKSTKQKRSFFRSPKLFIFISCLVLILLLASLGVLYHWFIPVAHTYKGNLPCADCSGIQETLTLKQQNAYIDHGTYTLSLLYQERNNNQPFITTGNWKTIFKEDQTHKTVIIALDENNPEKVQYFLQLNPTTLSPLDNHMQPIQSPFNMNLISQ